MSQDKYSAVWVSNSSISDFLNCPRLYYLRNVYKDPKTNHKVNIISPALALGQIVHEVLESLSFLPSDSRLNESLLDKYDIAWKKVSGKLGGFTDEIEEKYVKERGVTMLKRVMDHPGPLLNKAIKIKKDEPNYLPHYYLSDEENIILCGKVDWLEYVPENGSVHIIDFKTGKNEEKEDSLQLPIYLLLVNNCQKMQVKKASYWYLDRDTKPVEVELPSLVEAYRRVLEAARKVKEARVKKEFLCPKNGCFSCRPFEAILKGEAEFVGVSGYSQDMYIL